MLLMQFSLTFDETQSSCSRSRLWANKDLWFHNFIMFLHLQYQSTCQVALAQIITDPTKFVYSFQRWKLICVSNAITKMTSEHQSRGLYLPKKGTLSSWVIYRNQVSLSVNKYWNNLTLIHPRPASPFVRQKLKSMKYHFSIV